MRDKLIEIWLDWVNNYLTVTYYAEANGLTVQQAKDLLHLAANVYNSKHPEA